MDTPLNEPRPRSSFSANWIYIGIILLLLGTVIYLFVTRNQTRNENEALNEQVNTVSNDKAALESEYNDALKRLDEMKSQGAQMDSLLQTKDGEISSMRNRIEKLLKQKNLSKDQLADANKLIGDLKEKMNGYQTQIESLKKENIQLTEDKKTLTEEKGTLTEEKKGLEETKKGLEKKVELASVLHASNIRMEAMHNAHTLFGKEKEKETEKASKTDFIRMRFDLDDNRISESGEKEIYICVFDPSGKVIAPSSLKFHLADNSEMSYTLSKTIPYKQGEKVKDIIAEWHPATMPGKGTYKVDIYHMGYKIGGERVTLH